MFAAPLPGCTSNRAGPEIPDELNFARCSNVTGCPVIRFNGDLHHGNRHVRFGIPLHAIHRENPAKTEMETEMVQ
jgi:hypothetical protein